MSNLVFAFDVDDTLYFERDYSLSALAYLGSLVEEKYNVKNGSQLLLSEFEAGNKDTISLLWKTYELPADDKETCIQEMRKHSPTLRLRDDALKFLGILQTRAIPFCLVTDGRSETQRLKIKALGLKGASVVSISEETGFMKPSPEAFAKVVAFANGADVVFVGDNPKKDFIYANTVGWKSVMVRASHKNIHPQALPENSMYHPQITIDSFEELEPLLSLYP
jgi:putative hydrolase of the HAD superfamily